MLASIIDICQHEAQYGGKEQEIANKMIILAHKMKCIECLDTKKTWAWRGQEYKDSFETIGFYYTRRCVKCDNGDNGDNLWIQDEKSNDLYGNRDIRIFCKDDNSTSNRYDALKKLTRIIYPEIYKESPKYISVKAYNNTKKERTYSLETNVSEIVKQCGNFIRVNCGDLSSIANLLSGMTVNMKCMNNESNSNNIICEKIDKAYIFICIDNKSRLSKKGFLNIFSFTKYNLDIDICCNIRVPENKEAEEECQYLLDNIASHDFKTLRIKFLSDNVVQLP